MRVDIGAGVRLFVDVEGPGLVPDGPAMVERPTVLLLHGGPGLDHTTYKTGRPNPLAELAQVVYLDQRGHGRSDWRSPEEWNLDTWADDVVRVCDALGIERPIVFGSSFGGSQRYLARHPGHASKVILAGTVARNDLDVVECAFARRGGEVAGRAARAFFGGDMSLLGDYLQHCMPLYSTEPTDPETLARGIMNLEVMAHFAAGEARTMDLRAGLVSAQCPVLVLAGGLDPVAPVELCEEIAASIPDHLVQLHVVPGISHLQIGGPTCTDLIKSFVAA
jgi:pimeloyl-ACP methyl ester carboxylesterase